MTEATQRLQQDKLRATMIQATRTLALQVATNAAKLKLRAKGFQVSSFTRRELVAFGEQYLSAHRDQLIAEAKAEVARWAASGVLGRRRQKAYQQACQGQGKAGVEFLRPQQ
jgi:hypothetical protein